MISVQTITVKHYIVELTQAQAEALAAILGHGTADDALRDIGLYDLYSELITHVGVCDLANKIGTIVRDRVDIPMKVLPNNG